MKHSTALRALLRLQLRIASGDFRRNPYTYIEVRDAIRHFGDPKGMDLPKKCPSRGTTHKILFNLVEFMIGRAQGGKSGNPYRHAAVWAAEKHLEEKFGGQKYAKIKYEDG